MNTATKRDTDELARYAAKLTVTTTITLFSIARSFPMTGSTSYCAANGPPTADYLLMSGARAWPRSSA